MHPDVIHALDGMDLAFVALDDNCEILYQNRTAHSLSLLYGKLINLIGNNESVPETLTSDDGLIFCIRMIEYEGRKLLFAEKQYAACASSLRLYKGVITTTGEGIWALRPNGDTDYVNGRLAEMLDHPVETVLQHGLFHYVPLEMRIPLKNMFDSALFGNQEEAEILFTKGNNKELWTYARSGPLYSREQKVNGVMFNLQDITERHWLDGILQEQIQRVQEYSVELDQQRVTLMQANIRLEALATTDGLTGLKNHRAFQEALVHELKQCSRLEATLSVILLDVDYFKRYNDTFGHPAGDCVLQKVAEILRKSVRGTDFTARYGGEEFAAILPGADEEGALRVAERIREGIESAEWRELSMTVSIGVTSAEKIDTPAALIDRADRGLYRSKENGRNRVTYIPPLSGVTETVRI